jgi:plasmid stabilization system protein ParE
MSRYRLTPEAARDLDEITDHLLAADAPAAAARIVDAIEEKCQALARMPEMGRRREELATGLRGSLVGPYVLFLSRHGRRHRRHPGHPRSEGHSQAPRMTAAAPR